MLVDLELEHSNLDGAVEIFGKSLLQCYNVTLWMSYMDFIKKVHPILPSRGQNTFCHLVCWASSLTALSVTCHIPVLRWYVLLLLSSPSCWCLEQIWNVE